MDTPVRAAASSSYTPLPPAVSGQPPAKNFIQSLPPERRAQLLGGVIIILGVVLGGAAIALGTVLIKKAVPLPIPHGAFYYHRGIVCIVGGTVGLVAMTAVGIKIIYDSKKPKEQTRLELTLGMMRDNDGGSIPKVFQDNPNVKDLEISSKIKILSSAMRECIPKTIETLQLSLEVDFDWQDEAKELLTTLPKLTQLTIKVDYAQLDQKRIEDILTYWSNTPDLALKKLVVFCESWGRPILNIEFCNKFAVRLPSRIGTTSRGHEFTVEKRV